MKTFVAAAFISLASVATAQLTNIPSCALSCFLTPLSSDGCSDLTDFACHCKKFDSLISSVTPCVQKACSSSEQATVITAVQSTCESAGVPVSVSSPIASSTSTPASSSSASSSSSSASHTSASIVSATSSPASSPASSAASSTSSAMSSASATNTTSRNSSTPTSSASPSASQFAGAASHFTPAVGVLGAAAAAFFVM